MPVSAVPLRGKLEEHSFSAVLRSLLHERRDGCLTVARGAITRRLYLRGGMITYGSSTERQDRLGEILIAQGKLSKADHKKYWELSKSGNRLLGITLLVNDRITLSDLYQGVTAQVVTILDRLQKWRKGEYEFEEGREPATGTVLLRIPLALYLRADSEKKPAAEKKPAVKKPAVKKPTVKKTAAKKTAAGAGASAKGAPAAAPPPDPPVELVPPPGVGEEGEREFEIVEEARAETIVVDAALEVECIGEVSFMVQELHKRLGQDPLTLLGVSPEADRAAVHAAFHRIAKVLHPDRLPRGCSPELVREADEIYREVTNASQVAEEEFRRKADAAAHPSPGAASEPAAQRVHPAATDEERSRRFFAQGREWIAKGNYWQASDALRQAVRLKPDVALYQQYLGLVLLQTKRMHEAEEHLSEAVRLEPNNPAHLVNLGRVFRAGRLYKKAREAFERALRIDPRNEHARDELRDLPEERPSRKPESGGLFKKLFGKG